jgi:GT2 family glycosyltransferase
MGVSLITLMKDKAYSTIRLLESIKNFYKGDDLQIIIGDTGSTAREQVQAVKYLLDYPFKVEYVKAGTYQFSKNNNFLAKNFAKHEILLFCNNDIELKNDAISKVVNLQLEKKNIATSGARLMFPNNTVQHCGMKLAFKKDVMPLKRSGITHWLFKQPYDESEWQNKRYVTLGNTGAFLCIKKDLFFKYNGFDERYKVCFEDVDLNFRLVNAGLYHYTDFSAECIHYESTTRQKGFNGQDINLIVQKLRKKSA